MYICFAQSCNIKLTSECNHIGWVTIDILPDDVLLDIFDFLVVEVENRWCTLVHVCRRWRNVIFGSPHRLNLQLICSDKTPVREMLDVWPPLPIVIRHSSRSNSGWDNVIAALGRNDRVCKIKLELDQQWENALEVMQEPFPALTDLTLHSDIEIASVVPDSFMGGSAPRLQYLMLNRVSIPGLPKLLSSATDLVLLKLRHIPHSGYISPEAIVTCLSMSPRLEKLYLGFDSPLSRPNGESRCLPPATPTVLPALIKLHFTGASEYLGDLVARIDSPLLDNLEIVLFHQLTFDIPHLAQFISRTPTLQVSDQACMGFSDSEVRVTFLKTPSSYHLTLKILCEEPEQQLSSVAQIFTSFFPRSLFHRVERLNIREKGYSKLEWKEEIEDRQWLEVLHPFTSVKSLRLSKQFAPRVVPPLQGLVGGRTTEVLPALEKLSLDLHPSGSFKKTIKKFVAARQLSNCPVVVHREKRQVV